jgi:hypothetical protein
MIPVEFPEQTTIWAKNQPKYLPLPAYTNDTETITCWSLTWFERLQILWKGHLWLRQSNFGRPLQPQLLCIESPFIKEENNAKTFNDEMV